MARFKFLAMIFPFIFGGCDFKIEDLKSFEFAYSTGNYLNAKVIYAMQSDSAGYSFSIKPSGVDENDAFVFAVQSADIAELETILNRYEISRWDGFKKSDLRVKDGPSFHLYVWLKNGKSVHASGYSSYPKNYKDFRKEMDEFFMRYNKDNQ